MRPTSHGQRSFGRADENLKEYRALDEHYSEVKFHYLAHRPNGHGQSYSMNVGAAHASGEYLCFLDDDDLAERYRRILDEVDERNDAR